MEMSGLLLLLMEDVIKEGKHGKKKKVGSVWRERMPFCVIGESNLLGGYM